METKKLNKNTLLNAVKSISSIIFPLITSRYVRRILGPVNIGKVDFSNSIVHYFSLIATLGVNTYAIRECAKVRERKEDLEKIASEIFSINLASTVISYLLLFITLLFSKKLNNYRELIIIQSTLILFTTLGADWINSAMEDFKYITIRTVLFQIISFILMLIFVKSSDDYIAYALITVLANSGAQFINIFYRGKYCSIRFVRDLNLRKHLKPILVLFAMIAAQTIFSNTDLTIIGLYRGDYEVGLYSTAIKIYRLVNTFVASIAFVVIPQMSEAFSKKDYDKANELAAYSIRFIITLGLPCIVGINVICPQIIELLSGPDFLEASTSLHILTIALGLSYLGGFIGNIVLIPSGKEKICLYSGIISAVVNLILNIIFIPKYGMNVAAVTTVIAEMIGLIIGLCFKDKNIKIQGIKNIVLGPMIGCAMIILISFVCKTVISNETVIAITTIVASVIAYLCVLLITKNQLLLSFFKKGNESF